MSFRRAAMTALGLALLAGPALAQAPYPPPGYPPPAYPAEVPQPLYAPAQLDALLAPIALYPDPLLTEILTAATYPDEVDQAARWRAMPQNAPLSDGALAQALLAINWEPSVKSLAAFPQVLTLLDQQLDWTTALGNAFLAQQAEVMDSIQRLRHQALAAGSLISNPYETVAVNGPYITIEPANPQYVYVPVYQPQMVYGAWPYPAEPPAYFGPPPGLRLGAQVGALGFAVGIPVVAALWDWGHWDWSHHDVQIDRDRFNHLDAGHPPVSRATWAHDPERRRGVPDRDVARTRKFAPAPGSPEQRQSYRFYAPGAQAAAAPTHAPVAATERRPEAPHRVAPEPPHPPVAVRPEAPHGPRPGVVAVVPPPHAPVAAAPARPQAPRETGHGVDAARPRPEAPPDARPGGPVAAAHSSVAVVRGAPPARPTTVFQAAARSPAAAAAAARGAASRAAAHPAHPAHPAAAAHPAPPHSTPEVQHGRERRPSP